MKVTIISLERDTTEEKLYADAYVPETIVDTDKDITVYYALEIEGLAMYGDTILYNEDDVSFKQAKLYIERRLGIR